MRIRNTLILAVLFAALAGYLFLYEVGRDPNEPQRAALLDFAAADVTRVTLEHPGRYVVLEREGDVWRLRKPLAAAADQRSVDNLIDAVADAAIVRTLDDAGELQKFGLDVPSAMVTLETGDGALPAVHIGKKSPVGGSVFVQVAGRDAVYTADAALATRLDKRAEDLRDKSILDFDSADVTAVHLATSTGPLVLERSGDDRWQVAGDPVAEASPDRVRNMLAALANLRATAFIDDRPDDLARHGLAEPALAVTVELAGGGTQELRLSPEKDGGRLVQSNRAPTVYSVGNWVAEQIDRDRAYFVVAPTPTPTAAATPQGP